MDTKKLKIQRIDLLQKIESLYGNFRYNKEDDVLKYGSICPKIERELEYLKDKMHTYYTLRFIDALFFIYLAVVNPNNIVDKNMKNNILKVTNMDICEMSKIFYNNIMNQINDYIENNYPDSYDIIKRCIDDKYKQICIYEVPNKKDTLFYAVMGSIGVYMTITSLRHLFLR